MKWSPSNSASAHAIYNEAVLYSQLTCIIMSPIVDYTQALFACCCSAHVSCDRFSP